MLLETLKPYAMRSRGILAYLEGDYASARTELETGLKIFATRNQHLKDSYINVTKAYLCCVLAKQGEMTEARKLLAEAREFLKSFATKQTELFEEMQRSDCAPPAVKSPLLENQRDSFFLNPFLKSRCS